MASRLHADHVDSMLRAAVRAPTADNRHVVALRIDGDSLELRARPELAAADSTRRLLGLLSAGAMLESVLIRASAIGRPMRAQIADPPLAGPVIARLVPTDDALPCANELSQAIESRCTNRSIRLRGPALDVAGRALWTRHEHEASPARIFWLPAGENRRLAGRLVRLAEATRFRSRELHQELFSSVRFDVGWSHAAAEGLPPGSLGLSVFERVGFRACSRWPVQRVGNLMAMDKFMAWRGAGLPWRLSADCGVVGAEGPLEYSAIQAGRLLLRIWLEATASGRGFQVLAASAVYAQPGATAVPEAVQRELQAGWRSLLGDETTPFVAFRCGFAAHPRVVSGRPDHRTLLAKTLGS